MDVVAQTRGFVHLRQLAARLPIWSAVLALTACGGGDADRFPDPGFVVVQVNDTLGRPVANVLCELKTADLVLVWRSGTTGADGRVDIARSQGGILPGDYAVTVKPPSGYSLAPAQAAVTPVVVRSNQETDVAVTLLAP
jgi:hypothetical protein